MALVHRNFRNLLAMVPRLGVRTFASKLERAIKKSVIVSQSNDIYTNLALEDWFYRNFDFTDHHMLMLWQNDPCIVIGRHQNPWMEANIPDLADQDVKFARRNSGGGTVFHDSGNLNMTFFTPREYYNRKYNLAIIMRAVFRRYGIKLDISKREDLLLRGCKVSGTAAKLGHPNAYHHCTLLVSADKTNLRKSLQKLDIEIKTNAPQSVRSKVINLSEENSEIQMDVLMEAIGCEYLRTPVMSLRDGGKELADLQYGFRTVDPTEERFPGITEIKNTYESWQWCYGRTPKFSMTSYFAIPDHLVEYSSRRMEDVMVTVMVENGHVSNVDVYTPPILTATDFSADGFVMSNIIGQQFSEDVIDSLERTVQSIRSDSDRFVVDCVRQVINSVFYKSGERCIVKFYTPISRTVEN